MEKLKKYNQKLLAIIGTTIIGGLLIALISGIGGLIVSAIDFDDSEDPGIQIQNSPVSQEQTDSIKIVRSQAVTFHSPIQLDTGYAKYIIPVGQVNLEKKEKTDYQVRTKKKYYSSNSRRNSFYGLFNNFIFYDQSSEFKSRIFEDKVAITDWSYLNIQEKELLIFKGTSDDTNLDNQLNKSDYQSLFVYYMADKRLIPYNFKNKTVLEFEPMLKTNFISIKVGVDKDKNLEYESNSEPQEILILDVNNRLVTNFISNEMKEELQNKVD
jgi:hypothetical protein